MFECIASSKGQHRFPATFTERFSVLILLLAISLLASSCGMPAQAASAKPEAAPHQLQIYGSLPTGKIREPYNAVLAVGGGSSPYYFSVKTGSLPQIGRAHV